MPTEADIKLAIASGNALRVLRMIQAITTLTPVVQDLVEGAIAELENVIDPLDDGGNVDLSECA